MARIIRQITSSFPILLKRKRVAAYARVSSEKDAALQSLSAQVSYYSEYIQRHVEWEYAGVYADEATTGTKDSRSEFQRLLVDCRTGCIDMVLTKSISRFARNTVTLLNTVRELRALGIDVFFERENIHSMTGEGELMLTILASFAQEESLSASLNCKWHYKKRFNEGKMAGLNFLYGYRISNNRIDIEPVEAEVVRSIFNDYTSGIGVTAIMRRLNESGVPTLRGLKWTQRQIDVILRNEKYTGNALLQKTFIADHLSKAKKTNRGELPKYYAEETHEPIIDQDTFRDAQIICEQNRQYSHVRCDKPSKYPFTSKIQCSNCGAKYRRTKVRNGFTWDCSSAVKFGQSICRSKPIPEETLMAVTTEVLGNDHFSEDIFRNKIHEIIVPSFNRLEFIFKNGGRTKRVWKDRSRKDSWTDEMKARARQNAIIQRERETVNG